MSETDDLKARQRTRTEELARLELTGRRVSGDEPNPCGDVVCYFCGWCDPSPRDIAEGAWDGEAWFCRECILGGYDHIPTEKELEESAVEDEFPGVYAELTELRNLTNQCEGMIRALNKSQALFEASYQFGFHHSLAKQDIPNARRVCLLLLGEMLSAIPEDKRNLDFGGQEAIDLFTKHKSAAQDLR